MARALNERIRLLTQPFADAAENEPQTDFVCECASETCLGVVWASSAEWRAVTAEPEYFLVRPDHVGAHEQAVVRTDRYAIVRARAPDEPGIARRGREVRAR